jgi:hypothetical protein
MPIPSDLVDQTHYLGLPNDDPANQTFLSRGTVQKNVSQPRIEEPLDPSDDSVVIQDPLEDLFRKEKYQYKPKHDELREGDIVLSSGNMYHEKKNPAIAKLLNSVQSNI